MTTLKCPWIRCVWNDQGGEEEPERPGICTAEEVEMKDPECIYHECEKCFVQNEVELDDMLECNTFRLHERWKLEKRLEPPPKVS